MLLEFKTEIETEYARQKDVAERDMARKGEVAKITAETERMGEKLELSYVMLNKKITSDIKRTVNEMLKKSEGGAVGGGGGVNMDMVMEKISGLLAAKADKKEVEIQLNGKANKIDTEMSLRWVDLLHKMLNQIIILIAMKFKSGLEKVGGESPHEKKNKKVQLLHWALVISKWVESFDSQNINDFYFEDAGKKDPHAIHTVQM